MGKSLFQNQMFALAYFIAATYGPTAAKKFPNVPYPLDVQYKVIIVLIRYYGDEFPDIKKFPDNAKTIESVVKNPAAKKLYAEYKDILNKNRDSKGHWSNQYSNKHYI